MTAIKIGKFAHCEIWVKRDDDVFIKHSCHTDCEIWAKSKSIPNQLELPFEEEKESKELAPTNGEPKSG